LLAKPKQIIVDKEALVGMNINALCDFAKDHLLLCCDTLLYECATASKHEPRGMLERYKKLIKNGAYYCSNSLKFIQSESKNCLPYPWFLPDLDATKKICTGEKRPEDLLDFTVYGKLSQPRYKVAETILNVSRKIKKRIDIEIPYITEEIKQLPSDTYERLQKLFEDIDACDLRQLCIDSVRDEWIKDKAKFCLSAEWISWQRIRLADVILMNYNYLRQTGGWPGIKRVEHDYHDMEYILLLSRADCLLTRDEKLVKPLAKTAFPEKDVFSSLEEVPDEYECHWK